MSTAQDWGDLSLMGLFCLEVESQVEALNSGLLALEKSAGCDRTHLDGLMRAAHSIKGAARIVQVEAAVKVAHALEDCFIAAQQGILMLTSDHLDVLLKGVDLLAALGQLEESALAEVSYSYMAQADEAVLAIEGMVSAAEKAAPLTPNCKEPAAELPIEPIVGIADKSIAASPDSTIANLSLEPQAIAPEPSARTVRISARNLNRLMGLAGESLVSSNWLQPFAQSLLHIKRQQQIAIAQLEKHQQSQIRGEPSHSSHSSISESDLNKAFQTLQSAQSALNEQISDLDVFARQFEQLSDRLYREVIAGHMCAFEESTQGYGRLIRDLSRQQGKQVKYEQIGATTHVDRDIAARLDAPISHLLTNAVVHGIEPSEQRLNAGKPAEGSIRLSAAHRSGMLVVTVEDDGAGVDFVALRYKVVDRGLTTAEVSDRLSEAELLEFLFLPGFSTASQVDSVAGRGYGLDLARTMAQSVGGSLQAISPTFEDKMTGAVGGMRFQFQLPLTLSVVRSLLFEVAGEPYAISLSRIVSVIKLAPEQIQYSQNRPYFSLENDRDDKGRNSSKENISLVSADRLLSLSPSPNQRSNQCADCAKTLSIIVIGEAGNYYGLRVDRFLEEKDLVVRPLDPRLGKVPNISAAALTDKGTPVLILDVADVWRSAEKIAGQDFSQGSSQEPAGPKQKFPKEMAQKRVLVVDDSMTVRAMEQKMLQNCGYAVDVAVDGVEGWNAMRMATYDLVITDVDMPRMSGIELIEKMRAYSATKGVPVIVVSYKDRAEDQMAGLAAGANYYLTKSSFHDDGLTNAVLDLIGS